jgi:hypothetical protein
MGLLQSEAVSRAEEMFGCGQAHERPADLIADIMQLCLVEGIDFQTELDAAREYVIEEQRIDADTVKQVLSNLEHKEQHDV